MTFNNACANINSVMKESTKTNKQINEQTIEQNETVDLEQDADVQAAVMRYKKEEKQRRVALVTSLMVNMMFLVAVYSIFCYDTTGRLFGRMLGINL